jgi:hypothetical protein
MGGLLVVALIAVYVWGAAKLFRRIGPYWAKALVAIAAILIPTADAAYGRIKLNQMCEAEGGLHIYRVVDGVEGFLDPGSEPHEGWLKTLGYLFVEGKGARGEFSRLSLNVDGGVLREEEVTPKSKYVFETKRGSPDDIYYRVEQSVRVRDSQELLGRAVNIAYRGGWFERFVSGLYASKGTADRCGQDISAAFITDVLKSIHREKAK